MFKKKETVPEKLNICLIGQNFPILSRASDTGFLWPVARGLQQRGHQVTVLSTKSMLAKPEVLRDGIRAYYLLDGPKAPRRADFKKLVLQKFESLHQENPFHIVHSLDQSAFRIAERKTLRKVAVAYDIKALHLADLFGILGQQEENLQSLIQTFFNLSYRYLITYFGLDRPLLRSADGIFVNSEQQRIILERYYMYPDAKIHLVPYGAEVGDLTPRDQSLELRQKLNIPEHASIALTILEMTDTEEAVPILRAFEAVAIKKPSSYLLIIGHGPRFKDIEFEVLTRALGSRVHMVGSVPPQDVPQYISIADAFIQLSARQASGDSTVFEAMGQRKIIIGSEVSDLVNIITDGEDGYLIRPADTEALAQILISLFLGQLPSELVGQKAHQKIVEMFDTKKMIETLIRSYEKILINSGQYRKNRTQAPIETAH